MTRDHSGLWVKSRVKSHLGVKWGPGVGRAAWNDLTGVLLDAVRGDPVCRRLMTAPGVGPMTALTFRCTVDVPARFARSRSVGAHFGLRPRKWQFGEIDHMGRISKCGNVMMRTTLRKWSDSRHLQWMLPITQRASTAMSVL